jgi:hypothetical protein
MRPLAALTLALLLVLAGCSTGFQGGTPTPETTSTPATETETETATDTPTAGTPAPTETGTATDMPTSKPTMQSALPDPPSDTIGWEGGYWYNETIPVNATDGLNETELDIVVNRSMARVEHVRQLEFRESVPVEVITRAEYREQYANGNVTYPDSFVTFDNAKFESLFLVGEDTDSLAVQNANRGSNVLGFYSPSQDRIVVISESDRPQLRNELTLGHELTHALQDQVFDLTSYVRPTRGIYNAYNGLFEGDSHYIEQRYSELCDTDWDCVEVPSAGGQQGGSSDLRFGVYILNYFPYSDGPGFVAYHERRGGWERVNAMYDDPPASSEQVIYPEKYGEDAPTNVTLSDTNSGEWERLRPESPRGNARPAYAEFGQSGMAAMFAYTLYDDYNRSRVVAPNEFLNLENGEVNTSDPLNYDLGYVSGWDGDRMYIYDTPGKDNETAYVWRSEWDSAANAEEFAAGYRELLAHWDGERAGSENQWVVAEGPFADAFYIEVDGTTVTIVNAPSGGDLGDVYAGYEPAGN